MYTIYEGVQEVLFIRMAQGELKQDGKVELGKAASAPLFPLLEGGITSVEESC